jgi:hypothetical protein
MSFPIAEKKSCPINSSPQTKLLLYTPPKLFQLSLILLLVYWDNLSDVSFPGTLAPDLRLDHCGLICIPPLDLRTEHLTSLLFEAYPRFLIPLTSLPDLTRQNASRYIHNVSFDQAAP